MSVVCTENFSVVCCSAAGSLMVSQCGQILIPTSSPAFLVVDFINKHAAEAKFTRQAYLTCVLSSPYYVYACDMQKKILKIVTAHFTDYALSVSNLNYGINHFINC
jgi:Domain of unknown function (DUF4461)